MATLVTRTVRASARGVARASECAATYSTQSRPNRMPCLSNALPSSSSSSSLSRAGGTTAEVEPTVAPSMPSCAGFRRPSTRLPRRRSPHVLRAGCEVGASAIRSTGARRRRHASACARPLRRHRLLGRGWRVLSPKPSRRSSRTTLARSVLVVSGRPILMATSPTSRAARGSGSTKTATPILDAQATYRRDGPTGACLGARLRIALGHAAVCAHSTLEGGTCSLDAVLTAVGSPDPTRACAQSRISTTATRRTAR